MSLEQATPPVLHVCSQSAWLGKVCIVRNLNSSAIKLMVDSILFKVCCGGRNKTLKIQNN